MGSLAIIHDRTPDYHQVSWAERAFDSQATWVMGVIGLFFGVLSFAFSYNQALADVRSTGAGIECLYCNFLEHMGLL